MHKNTTARGERVLTVFQVVAGRLRQGVSCLGIVAITSASFPLAAHAAPVLDAGGTGNALISQDVSGNTTVIQADPAVVINWQSFNTGVGETTQFLQPSSDAIAVNRVTTSTTGTQIDGALNANGRIVIIDPNGIAFGKDSKVNVGALLATTTDAASDSDAIAGKFSIATTNNNARIVNDGSLTASSGMVGLVAPSVINNGAIVATMGSIFIGASKTMTVDFTGDGMISFPVDGSGDISTDPSSVGDALLVNSEGASLAGKNVFITAKAAAGIVQKVISVGGTVTAKSVSDVGGQIVLNGGQGNGISVVNATLDGSAATAYRGAQNAIMVGTSDASSVTIQNSTLNASANDSNNGRITVQAAGSIQIEYSDLLSNGPNGQGAVVIGNEALASSITSSVSIIGGSIDISSKTLGGNLQVRGSAVSFQTRVEAQSNSFLGGTVTVQASYLDITGASVDASQPAGVISMIQPAWLLYADNILIADPVAGADAILHGRYAQGTSVLSAAVISESLGHNNVYVIAQTLDQLSTEGKLTVLAPISWNAPTQLGLYAAKNVEIAAPVSLFGENAGIFAYAAYTGSSTPSEEAGLTFLPGGKFDFLGPVNDDGEVKQSFTYYKVYSAPGGGTLFSGSSYKLLDSLSSLVSHVNADPKGDYALARDDGGYGFSGTPMANFYGHLFGLGHTLSDVSIDAGDAAVGLFGTLDGQVSDLTLENFNVTATAGGAAQAAGILAGSSLGSAIVRNVKVSGSVDLANGYAGGLIGINDGGKIFASSSSAVVENSGTDRDNYVGGLVGANFGTITNSSASGMVIGARSYNAFAGGLVGGNGSLKGEALIFASFATGAVDGGRAGGLVGRNWTEGMDDAVIGQSYATGTVTGSAMAGGLVANNESAYLAGTGIIETSYATGNVTKVGDYSDAGGFVGHNDGSISESWASGNVEAVGFNTAAGGFAGYNGGSIHHAYALGSVTGGASGSIGGFVGFLSDHGSIDQAYSTGKVEGGAGSSVGGFLGMDFGNGGVTNSYWDTNTSGTEEAAGYSFYGVGVTAVSSAVDASDPIYAYNWNSYSDFDDDWVIINADGRSSESDPSGTGATRPFLFSEIWNDGSGTRTYSITNSHQLQLIAVNLFRTYKIANEIDMGDMRNVSGMWRPVDGSDGVSGFIAIGGQDRKDMFFGSLSGYDAASGKSHVISNLTMRSDQQYVGLFSVIDGGRPVSVADFNIVNADIRVTDSGTPPLLRGAHHNVGVLVGFSNGSVAGIGVSGTINAEFDVPDDTLQGYTLAGGLAGFNGGEIYQAGANVAVSVGNWGNAGGLVGGNYGRVEQSYATGRVSGGDDASVGGLVGYNGGYIGQAYATGAVHVGDSPNDEATAGGLVGYNNGDIFETYATGFVTGGEDAQTGGLFGYTAPYFDLDRAYFDIDTTGQIQSHDGSIGLNTAQLQNGLQKGFDRDVWSIVSGESYAYFKWRFPSGVDVISGKVYLSGPETVGTDDEMVGQGLNVSFAAGGKAIGVTSSGANGYYNMLVDPGTTMGGLFGGLPKPADSIAKKKFSGPGVIAFLDGGAGVSYENNKTGGDVKKFVSSLGNVVDDLNVYAGTLSIQTGFESLAETDQGFMATLGEVTDKKDDFNTLSDLLEFAPYNVVIDVAQPARGGPIPRAKASAPRTSDFYVDEALTTNGKITLRNKGNIIFTADGQLSGLGEDAAVVVATGQAFVNERGSDALVANSKSGNGYWAVYSDGPGENTFGDLDSGNTAIWNEDVWDLNPNDIGHNSYVFAQGQTLTVTGKDAHKTYGVDASADLMSDTYIQVSGLDMGVKGAYLASKTPNLSDLIAVSSDGAAAKAGVAGGPYTLVINALKNKLGYDVMTTDGTITIDPKALTALLTGSITKAYDGTTSVLSFTYLLDGGVAGDTVTLNATGAAYADKNAGTAKTVTISGLSLSGASAANYTIASTASGANGVITPASLAVTVGDATRAAGAANPAFTFLVSGLVGGDTTPGLTGLTISTTADASSAAGSYAIVSAGGTSLNYVITIRSNGTLFVTAVGSPAPAIATPTLAPGYAAALQAPVVKTASNNSTTFQVNGTAIGALVLASNINNGPTATTSGSILCTVSNDAAGGC